MSKVNIRIDFFSFFLAGHGRVMVVGLGKLLVKTKAF
jgi:hypothetical protein